MDGCGECAMDFDLSGIVSLWFVNGNDNRVRKHHWTAPDGNSDHRGTNAHGYAASRLQLCAKRLWDYSAIAKHRGQFWNYDGEQLRLVRRQFCIVAHDYFGIFRRRKRISVVF